MRAGPEEAAEAMVGLDTVRLLNVNTPHPNDHLRGDSDRYHRYQVMRSAILRVLPSVGNGMTWEELVEAVAPRLPNGMFTHMGSVRWYTRAVQSDLETRGWIERVPGSGPPRLRCIA
jgi:Family of unknown function (DUF6958)